MFAGTKGNGVWKIPLSEILTEVNSYSNMPQSFYLYQNYPNPFNPKTIIRYRLKMFSHVKIKIYDILSNEVKSLVDKNQNEGTYEIEFDGSNLSSGIYFYKLEADNFSEFRKMIFLK
ncbi:MAG: T9SS type A sorting domain-containing protein [Bacteroidota bacterium]|nr:T9SS type A sorting domain-containing protein [Bacteroidota bacterium]